MKPLAYRQVAAVLRGHGFQAIRTTGSHVRWGNAAGRFVTVPFHGNTPLKQGTLLSIARQSGIDKAEFEKA